MLHGLNAIRCRRIRRSSCVTGNLCAELTLLSSQTIYSQQTNLRVDSERIRAPCTYVKRKIHETVPSENKPLQVLFTVAVSSATH